MIAIRKHPGEQAEVIDVDNTLKALQEEVGGYIEAVTFAENGAIICDEEGRLKGKQFNCRLFEVNFVGTILIVGIDGDGFCDVPKPGELIEIIGGHNEKIIK